MLQLKNHLNLHQPAKASCITVRYRYMTYNIFHNSLKIV